MISIKTQKIIKYIPLANFFIFHIWVYNYVNMPKKKRIALAFNSHSYDFRYFDVYCIFCDKAFIAGISSNAKYCF